MTVVENELHFQQLLWQFNTMVPRVGSTGAGRTKHFSICFCVSEKIHTIFFVCFAFWWEYQFVRIIVFLKKFTMGWGQQLSYPQTGGSAEEGLGTTRLTQGCGTVLESRWLDCSDEDCLQELPVISERLHFRLLYSRRILLHSIFFTHQLQGIEHTLQ